MLYRDCYLLFGDNDSFLGNDPVVKFLNSCDLEVIFLRKKNFKGRCEKRRLPKCEDVCRTFDALQYTFADVLNAAKDIKSFRVNVLLDGLEKGDYTSDFVCVKMNGDLIVRECLERKYLIKSDIQKAVSPCVMQDLHWQWKTGAGNWKKENPMWIISAAMPWESLRSLSKRVWAKGRSCFYVGNGGHHPTKRMERAFTHRACSYRKWSIAEKKQTVQHLMMIPL